MLKKSTFGETFQEGNLFLAFIILTLLTIVTEKKGLEM